MAAVGDALCNVMVSPAKKAVGHAVVQARKLILSVQVKIKLALTHIAVRFRDMVGLGKKTQHTC